MANYTSNLNLRKPLSGELYDVVADHNDAMDKIDVAVGTNTKKLADNATVYASMFKTPQNDWGEAINLAIASITSGTVVLPGGVLTYSTNIIQKSNVKIKGHGIYATTLNPVGCHGISVALDQFLRFASIEDLSISGDNGGDLTLYDPNRNGINWNSGSTEVYQCSIKNVRIQAMRGKGIFIPFDFNNLLENISVSTCGGNGIELYGFITDTLINCHVDYVANGKCAYRIYSRAHLISCNGMGGNGEYWGVFGRRDNLFVDTVGGEVTQHWIVFENCNVEDFTKVGVKFLFAGGFEFRNTDFMAPTAGTFVCFIEMDNINKMSTIDGLTRFESKGAAMTAIEKIVSTQSQAALISYNPDIIGFTVDGVNTVSIPVISTEYEYLDNVLALNKVNIKAMTYYYLGGNKHTAGESAPTGGVWNRGDFVHKTNPVDLGTYVVTGYICIESGTPGVWVEVKAYYTN